MSIDPGYIIMPVVVGSVGVDLWANFAIASERRGNDPWAPRWAIWAAKIFSILVVSLMLAAFLFGCYAALVRPGIGLDPPLVAALTALLVIALLLDAHDMIKFYRDEKEKHGVR